MMQYLPFTVQHAFAGLRPLVWQWGTPAAIIILAGLGEVALGFAQSDERFGETGDGGRFQQRREAVGGQRPVEQAEQAQNG